MSNHGGNKTLSRGRTDRHPNVPSSQGGLLYMPHNQWPSHLPEPSEWVNILQGLYARAGARSGGGRGGTAGQIDLSFPHCMKLPIVQRSFTTLGKDRSLSGWKWAAPSSIPGGAISEPGPQVVWEVSMSGSPLGQRRQWLLGCYSWEVEGHSGDLFTEL